MKTANLPLRNQQSVRCPACGQYTEQSRGAIRGERHCWCCGESFTLSESRAALAMIDNEDKHKGDVMRDNRETVPCGLCGEQTPMTSTKRCDRCWELESRIKYDPELAQRILEQVEKET